MTALQCDAPVSRESLNEQMHLVRIIVARFARRLPPSVQREDLLAAGTAGLFRALQTSGHLRATCPEMFASYAKIRIRGFILDELRRHDWSPRRRRAQASNDATAETKPNDSSLKRREALPVHVIGFDDVSPEALPALLAEVGQESRPGSWGTRSPEDELEEKSAFAKLRHYVAELPARERSIIQMRYFEGIPCKDIAAMLGLSEARVSQLHARATMMLRGRLSEEEVALAA
jgi:RNA polymerase sigma factor FliA